MSAATFQKLREEFARGWLELHGKHFTLHIFTPSFTQGGHCPLNPEWKEVLPFDRKTDKLIGSVHLPYSANTDDRENFTNSPGSVVVKPWPSSVAAKDAPLFASVCELFQELSNKAGAALPEVIRKRLVGYCSWQCDAPASWWFALLANMTGKTVYHSDGTYNDHNIITGPWELSIRLIDYFGLDTDSPTWPEVEPPKLADGRYGPDGFYLDGVLVTDLTDNELALLNLALDTQPIGPTDDDVSLLTEFKSWTRERIDKLLGTIKTKFLTVECPRVLRWANRHLVFREPRQRAKVTRKSVAKTSVGKAGRKPAESLQKAGRHKRRR